MDIPVTPELFTMQANTRGQQGITEAANEIMGLLDDLTFNEQEERILAILSVLPPADFMRCLGLMSMHTDQQMSRKGPYEINYLERLYIDLNGAEFDALCFMMRSRLLAAKCGTLERAEEVMRAAFTGKTSPEIPLSLDYGRSKLTSPSTFSRRTYPYNVKFAEDGSISGDWYEHIGWYKTDYSIRKFKMQLADLSVAHHIHVEDKNEIVTLFDVKRMSDDVQISFWFTTVNVIDMALGCGAVAAAKGVAKRALAAFIQVAVPALGQLLDDHEEWLLESAIGREVLTAFRIFSLGLAGFGVAKLMSTGGKSLIDRLAKAKDDLLAGNSGNAIAQKISDLVDGVIDTFKDLKAEFSATLLGSKAPKRAAILDELKNRQPFHPQVPPPIVTGGSCIATGKSELEIFVELEKKVSRSDLSVYQKGDDFILIEAAAGSDVTVAGGYVKRSYFTKIIDIFDDVEAAKKALLVAATRAVNLANKFEVGIYKKVIDGKVRYAVVDGQRGRVNDPAAGWIHVGHYHHEADIVPGYRFPAVQDFLTTVGDGTKRQVEIIFSRNAKGEFVQVEYGYDPKFKHSSYFVKTGVGTRKRFKFMFPESVEKQVNAINADTTLSEFDKVLAKARVFRTLDPDVFYAGWLATHFP